MKQLILNWKTALLVCMLGISISTYANRNPDIKSDNHLRTQIIKLIEKPDLTLTDIEEEKALLHFMVNAKGEVVVLVVDTENNFIDQYLKERLNYKKLKGVATGRYTMKVIIQNGSRLENTSKMQSSLGQGQNASGYKSIIIEAGGSGIGGLNERIPTKT
jgi:hypothetical protein